MGKGPYRLRVKAFGGRGSKGRLVLKVEEKPSLLAMALTLAGRTAGKGVKLAASALADAVEADKRRAEPVMGATGRRMAEAVLPRARQTPAQPLAAEPLLPEIEAIDAYTRRHPELMHAHHFLFDLRHPRDGRPQFVVMGINPGEGALSWKVSPQRTEETSRFDFHAAGGNDRETIPFVRRARAMLDGADYVQTELFFWSSDDIRQLEARYGRLKGSKHLSFCTRLNRRLMEVYRPRAVVFPGLAVIDLCVAEFGLRHVRSVRDGGHRLIEHYTDRRRPWIFTKHWTGSHGFSAGQQETIRAYIAGNC